MLPNDRPRARRVPALLGVLATFAVVVAALVALPAAPAQAFIGNVIPMNEEEEPTDTFTTANALVAYVTTDPQGGRVCVVPESTENPGDGTLSCDGDAAAWVSPQFVSSIGSFFLPLKGPYLRQGTWKLLADSTQGAPDALSIPFTVTPCEPGPGCDTTIAADYMSRWKVAALEAGGGMQSMCTAAMLYDAATDAKQAQKLIRVGRSAAAREFVATGSGQTVIVSPGMGIITFPSINPSSALIEFGMGMIQDLSCATALMYQGIVDDPPDPNYDEIATPDELPVPTYGDPVLDGIGTELSDIEAFGTAQRISVERFQGAMADDDLEAAARQAEAVADFGDPLVDSMRDAARHLHSYADGLADNADADDPVTTQAELDETVALYQRVRASGLTTQERQQLVDGGLTAAEIAAVDAAFDIDIEDTPVGPTMVELVDSAADDLETAAEEINEFSLAAGSVAAVLGTGDPGNHAPVAVDDVLATSRGVQASVNVLSNDTDADGDILTIGGTTDASHGAVECQMYGYCSYTPEAGYAGPDSFTYTADDGRGGTDQGMVDITVAANGAPTLGVSSISVTGDQLGSAEISDVWADPDGDTPIVISYTDPVHGTASCDPDGTCTWRPGGYRGPDGFNVTVSDGNDHELTGFVNLNANPVPPTPIVSDGPLTSIAISEDLNCDIRHEGDAQPAFFSGTACGTFLVVDDVLYSPLSIPAGVHGTTWFVEDQSPVTGAGTESDPYRIVSTVQAGSSGVELRQTDSYVVGQESYVTDIRIANSGPARTVRLYRAGDCFLGDSDTGRGAVNEETGSVACKHPDTDRVEQFTPLSPGSHYYEAIYGEVWSKIASKDPFPDTCRCDEVIDNGAGLQWDVDLPAGGEATRSSLITFSPEGAEPLVTSKSVDDGDVGPGDPVSYTITVSNPGAEPAQLDEITDDLPSGFTYTPGSSAGVTTQNPTTSAGVLHWDVDVTVPADGEVELIFDATAAITAGSYFNNAGGSATDLAVLPTGETAQVTVSGTPPVNRPPVANDDVLTVDEDASATLVAVLANDTDPDGDSLAVTDHGNASHGTVTCTATGCTYQPAAGYSGPDSFTYTVSDGHNGSDQGSVAVTVRPVNHPPTAVDDTLSVDEDDSAAVAVLANDTDPDGDSLIVTDHGAAAHGTVTCTATGCTYQPTAGYAGPDSFTYTVSDGHNGSDQGSVAVTVRPLNDPPTAVDDSLTADQDSSGSVAVLANDTDPDGDSLTVTGHGNPAHGTVVCSATSCTYTPTAGYSGPDAFTYTVADGHAGTDEGTVSVTVRPATPVNHPPTAADDSLTVDQDSSGSVGVLANDTDPDGDSLTVTGHGNPAHGTVVCGATSCTYTPTAGYSGPDAFTYTVADGHDGADEGSVAVTVRPASPVNHPPTAVDDTLTTPRGMAGTVTPVANDTDPDGDVLQVAGHGSAGHGTVSCTTTVCTYAPATGFSGSDSFTYTVSDGHGGEDQGTVTITVTSPTSGVDVALTMSDLRDPVAVGNNAGYKLTVKNTSSRDARNIVVTDQLPAGFKLRDVAGANCTVSSGLRTLHGTRALTCTITKLRAWTSMTITIRGAFLTPGIVPNTAALTADSDTNLANNTASASTKVTGSACTIVGTFGADRLKGTSGRDVVCGLAGDDIIDVRSGGADIAYGNDGNDLLYCDRADILVGGPGNDVPES